MLSLRDLVKAVYFLSIFSNEHQKIPPANHQQKCLINGICDTFGIQSNYFGPVVPKKLKRFEKFDESLILNAKNVFLQINQKLHCYDQISGWRCH